MYEVTEEEAEAIFADLSSDPRPGWLGPWRWRSDELGELQPEPLWHLVEGLPEVVDDADPAEQHEAWQAAAAWTQRRVDDFVAESRRADVALTRGLLLAYRTSLRDADVRFGSAQSHRGSQAAQLFFKQTALQVGQRPGQLAHRIDTALTLTSSMPALWDVCTFRATSWQAVDLAVRMAEGLSDEQRAAYDGRAAVVVADVPLAALKRRLRKIRADVRKDDQAEQARTVHERRSLVTEHGDDGEGSLTLTGPIVDIVAMESAIRLGAIAARGAEDETRPLAQLQ